MKDIILYHGSKGGIDGSIKPISRKRCDFGSGFYMGQSPEQVQGLVVEDAEPYFYTVKLKLSEIPEDRILRLQEDDWLYTVLACRKKLKERKNTVTDAMLHRRIPNHSIRKAV